jgi:hypothetical protein
MVEKEIGPVPESWKSKLNYMHSMGTKTNEIVRKLMGMKNDVNYGKTYVPFL